MTRTTLVVAAALALVGVLSGAPAQAQALRTFVSTSGLDTNPCTITQPCRHFQAAVDVTAVGGEVDALDAGSYSPIMISHAITINGQGWSYLAPNTGGNGITITAVTGNVTISGVSINGVGVTGGTNGIVFNSGGSLTVTESVLQNFSVNGPTTTGNGILIQPTAGPINFAITNSIFSGNTYVGIDYLPPSGSANANGVIDHVVVTNNDNGIAINTNHGGGITTVAISNSVASNNSDTGFDIETASSSLAVSIDSCNISGNFTGIYAIGTPKILLGRSVITSNAENSISNGTSNTFYTYQNNQINLNGSGNGVSGNPLSDLGFQ